MEQKLLWCYARGVPGSWEAICVDLDISVQGRSLADVTRLLNEAVDTYIEDALKEDAATAHRLLTRRAPAWVRWKHALAYMAHVLRGDRHGKFRSGFDIPCHA